MRKPTLYHFDIRTEIDEEKRNETKRTSSLVRSSIVFVSGETIEQKKEEEEEEERCSFDTIEMEGIGEDRS